MNDMVQPDPLVVNQGDILQAVRESAVLADVSISMWGGTRTDAKLLNEMKAQHGAVGDVGRVVKNLMAGADGLLKQTRSAYAAVRLRHYALTLPWVSDPHASRQEGPRLLPHMITDRYMTEMQALRRVAIAQLEEFLTAYPDLITQAQANLGTMAGFLEYPSVDDLRASFRIHFDFEPLPEFRKPTDAHGASVGTGIPLSDFMLDRLGKMLHKKQQRQIEAANKIVWERAIKPVKNLIERLSEADQKYFKQSTLNSVKEIVALLPGWNVTGDPVLTEITEDIEDLITGLDRKTLSDNPKLRTSVIADAQKVADKMAKWGM